MANDRCGGEPSDIVEIVGVCSMNRGSAEAVARRFEIPFFALDFAGLLARPDVYAVDLCIPAALRHTFAVQAAEAGKHII
jgi:predicted dehydrogenase